MLIIRTKTVDGKIHEFSFDGKRDLEIGVNAVKCTGTMGFSAFVKEFGDHKGEILSQWDGVGRLSYTIKSRAYADHVCAKLGTKTECEAMAKEINDKATCWASTTACVRHIVGTMYETVFTDPYTD